MNKVCSTCKRELPATSEYFRIDNRLKCGLRAECRNCGNEKASKRRKANKELHLKRTRVWRSKNKEYVSNYNKKYRSKNKDKVNYLWKDYYEKHKLELLNAKREYNRANPDKVSSWYRRRVSRINNTIVNFSHEDWLKCKTDFNNCCAYCGKKKKLTREHFYPLNLGGEYTKSNIIPACFSCNSSKQDTLFNEWYPKQKFYSKIREEKILRYLGYKNNIQQLSLL